MLYVYIKASCVIGAAQAAVIVAVHDTCPTLQVYFMHVTAGFRRLYMIA